MVKSDVTWLEHNNKFNHNKKTKAPEENNE
jgi:hypothetical protein